MDAGHASIWSLFDLYWNTHAFASDLNYCAVIPEQILKQNCEFYISDSLILGMVFTSICRRAVRISRCACIALLPPYSAASSFIMFLNGKHPSAKTPWANILELPAATFIQFETNNVEIDIDRFNKGGLSVAWARLQSIKNPCEIPTCTACKQEWLKIQRGNDESGNEVWVQSPSKTGRVDYRSGTFSPANIKRQSGIHKHARCAGSLAIGPRAARGHGAAGCRLLQTHQPGRRRDRPTSDRRFPRIANVGER